MGEPDDDGPTAALAPRATGAQARPRPLPPPPPSRTAAATAARELSPGDVVDGRFRVTRRAGAEDGVVAYEVVHARTGRALSLRLAQSPVAAEALEREARAAGDAGRHALAVVDLGTSEHGTWLVGELPPGQSLRALLDDAGQLPLEASVEIALAVAEHLHAAHARGLVHRELRPEVVLLDDDPSGAFAVKVVGPRPDPEGVAPTPARPPAAAYMALEQLRGAAELDARADVHALGAVLYECLAGRRPYTGASVGELVVAHCAGAPTHLARLRPDLPSDACDVVMRALAARPEERPATMIALATALAPFGDGWHARWLRRHGVEAPAPAAPAASIAPASDSPPPSRRPAPAGDRDTPTELYRGAHAGPHVDAQTAVLIDPHALRGEPVIPFVPAPAPAAPAAPAPTRPPRDVPGWERAIDRALGDLGDVISRATGRDVALFEVESRAAKLALVASLAFMVVGLLLLLLAVLR